MAELRDTEAFLGHAACPSCGTQFAAVVRFPGEVPQFMRPVLQDLTRILQAGEFVLESMGTEPGENGA